MYNLSPTKRHYNRSPNIMRHCIPIHRWNFQVLLGNHHDRDNTRLFDRKDYSASKIQVGDQCLFHLSTFFWINNLKTYNLLFNSDIWTRFAGFVCFKRVCSCETFHAYLLWVLPRFSKLTILKAHNDLQNDLVYWIKCISFYA